MQEFLEKNWTSNLNVEDATRLTIKALMEVVDSGSKNIEIAVLKFEQPVQMLTEDELQAIITDIEREIEEAKRTTASEAAMET